MRSWRERVDVVATRRQEHMPALRNSCKIHLQEPKKKITNALLLKYE